MRTAVSVKAVTAVTGLFFLSARSFPAAGVHQSSIRAQAAAYDVSIRSSTSASAIVEGGRPNQ